MLALAGRAGATGPGAAELAPMLWPFRAHHRPSRAGRALVAVGTADAIALPGAATALAQAWGAELRRYPRGHLTLLFCCEALRRDVRGFLGERRADHALQPAGMAVAPLPGPGA